MFIDLPWSGYSNLIRAPICCFFNQSDTDPAARLLDGWQEGVVPLVLQKALWSEAEAEGESSNLQKQRPPKLYAEVFGRQTESWRCSSFNIKQNMILHFPSSYHTFQMTFYHFEISLHFDGIPTWLPQHNLPIHPSLVLSSKIVIFTLS